VCDGVVQVSEHAVTRLDPSKIVDTNGAGDAFVGGFLSQMVQVRGERLCDVTVMWCAMCVE